MQKKKRFISKLNVLVLVTMMSLTNNGLGLVHCQSEDGHVEIELIGSGCCSVGSLNLAQGPADVIHETFSISGDNCGLCVDSVFHTDIINAAKPKDKLLSAVTAVPVILSISLECYDRFFGYQIHLADKPIPVNPSLPSIRTVILLA